MTICPTIRPAARITPDRLPVLRTLAALIVVVLASLCTQTASAQAAPEGWWRKGYAVDYGLIVTGGLAYLLRTSMEPGRPAFGPDYDPNKPLLTLDPSHSDRIGRTFLAEGTGETVSKEAVIGLIAGTAGLLALTEGIPVLTGDGVSGHRFHDTMIGFLEGAALTAALTELAKPLASRLRPDFQDRLRRYLCATNPPKTLDCGGVGVLSTDPERAKELLADGRRSFFSGHSSNSFHAATWLSLAIGGNWVWGQRSTGTSRALGVAAQTVLMSTASFIAGSRLDDGRHHATDVLVGAIVGIGMANLSYWRRFDSSGGLRDN